MPARDRQSETTRLIEEMIIVSIISFIFLWHFAEAVIPCSPFQSAIKKTCHSFAMSDGAYVELMSLAESRLRLVRWWNACHRCG